MKRLVAMFGAASVVGCGGPNAQLNEAILQTVKDAAGSTANLQFSDPMWCSQTVEGKRAAMIAAVGPVMAGASSGAGGYLIEVLADGTLERPVKASPPDPNAAPSSEALRIDRAYCEGKLVAAPHETMTKLRNMQNGQF